MDVFELNTPVIKRQQTNINDTYLKPSNVFCLHP